MSLDRLHEDAARAAQAKDLIENELLQSAFDTLKADYIKQWELTTVDQQILREKYWLAARVVGVVKDHLARILENGKLAQAELHAFHEKEEHKRRFGIL
jgi:hypothetical protein